MHIYVFSRIIIYPVGISLMHGLASTMIGSDQIPITTVNTTWNTTWNQLAVAASGIYTVSLSILLFRQLIIHKDLRGTPKKFKRHIHQVKEYSFQ